MRALEAEGRQSNRTASKDKLEAFIPPTMLLLAYQTQDQGIELSECVPPDTRSPMRVWFLAIPVLLAASALPSGANADEAIATIEIESIQDAELPKRVALTEAVKVQLVGESGRPGMVVLPKGANVEVAGRDGAMLQIRFVKSAGQIDILKTTTVEEVAKIRAANKAAEKERVLQERIDASWQDRLREIEEEKKRDILVHSWTWRPTSGGEYYEAVGEIENESGRMLENVQVEVTIRDASNNMVSTETAIVSDRDLQLGQRTTFRAMIRRVGGEQTASLAFRKFWGDRYTHRDK